MLKTVFMGSPEFSLAALTALHAQYQVVGVVTQPDRASGRGREVKAPPVKMLAQQLNIPCTQPQKLREPQAMQQLQDWQPDLIVVAAFGQILRSEVLDLPRYGCLNIHASLLPRWRGAAPINAAILAGDEETGITIMKMDKGLDTGPMLAKKPIRLQPHDTTGSVLQALSTLGADLLMQTLPDYLAGRIVPVPQIDQQATYAPMLTKLDGCLDFSESIIALERRVRAMKPWPGAWFEWNGNLLKVARVCIQEGRKGRIGSRFRLDGNPAVMSADGALVLEEVQPSGKKVMTGKAFLSGARDWDTPS